VAPRRPHVFEVADHRHGRWLLHHQRRRLIHDRVS
jgi:hypothetical protein